MENFNQLREAAMKAPKTEAEKPKEKAPAKRSGQEEGKMVVDGQEITEDRYVRDVKKTFPDIDKKKAPKTLN